MIHNSDLAASGKYGMLPLRREWGVYDEGIRGPLILVIGGMHGNEIAGVKAIDYVLKMLEVEHITRPDFRFHGRFVGLAGNLEALRRGIRFVDQDLNRIWDPERIERLRGKETSFAFAEEHELQSLHRAIEREVLNYQPEQLVILDLHTTSADGGCFIIPADNERSLRHAIDLQVPVVCGLLGNLRHTCLGYLDSNPWGIPAIALSFESGRHEDPASIYRAIAGIINSMRSLGCIRESDVESRHNELLQAQSAGHPRVTHLVYRHPVAQEDQFVMEPGWHNFQRVKEGDLLAQSNGIPLYAPDDSFVLMPLYQRKGSDGYFLVRADEEQGYF